MRRTRSREVTLHVTPTARTSPGALLRGSECRYNSRLSNVPWRRADGAARSPQRHPTLRRLHRGRRRQLCGRCGRVFHAARAFGLRQDHAPADDCGIRPARCRRHRPRRRRPQGHAARTATHPHGVPELRALSAHDGGAEHRFPAQNGRQIGKRYPCQGAGSAGTGEARRKGGPVPARTLGRPEAAGRPGARSRQPTSPAAARRASRRARREAARADAVRADPAAARRRRWRCRTASR